MSRFVPEPYKADGGFSVTGLPILVVALCAAAAGLGWLASFIGQWFYLILLFPIGIGFGLVFAGAGVGHYTKMRSPGVAVLLGLVSSAVAVLSMHYFNYQRFLTQREEVLKMAPLLDMLPANPADPKMAEAVGHLKEIREVNSFPRYLNMEARQGVSISHRGQEGFNLGYVGTWIYWGLEFVAVAFMAAGGLLVGAAAPYCSACDSWKVQKQLGTLHGKGESVDVYLSNGEIERLQAHDPAPSGGDLVLSAAVCPRCQTESPIAVKLESLTKNAKGEIEKKELLHVTYPGEALPELEALFVPKPKPAEESGEPAVQ